MKKILLFLLLLGVLIAPVLAADDAVEPSDNIKEIEAAQFPYSTSACAALDIWGDAVNNVTYTPPEGCSIDQVYFTASTDGTYSIILTRADGTTITGSVIQSRGLLYSSDHRAQIEGKWFNSTSWAARSGNLYIDQAVATNTSDFYLLGKKGWDSRRLEIPVSNLVYNPIKQARITLAGGGTFYYTMKMISDDELGSDVDFTKGGGVISNVLDKLTLLKDTVITIVDLGYWLVYGLGLVWILMMAELGMAAYYANSSKDVFQFYTKMAKGNRNLFDFIIGLVNSIIQIAVNIKNSIPFLKWI